VGKTHEELQQDLAKQPLTHTWQRKIKQALDPNNLGDRMYPTLDERENKRDELFALANAIKQ